MRVNKSLSLSRSRTVNYIVPNLDLFVHMKKTFDVATAKPKVFLSAGSSIAPYLGAIMGGFDIEVAIVNDAMKSATGEDYSTINPTGILPSLWLPGDQWHNDFQSIVLYILQNVSNSITSLPAID